MFGIPVKSILIVILVLSLIGGGAWVMNQHSKVKALELEVKETEEAIRQYRRQEKLGIEILQKKQEYVKKATKIKDAVNELDGPNYTVTLPEPSRVLINTAIDEANNYISSTN